MTLKHLGFTLGIFLFLPNVQAMDVPDEENTLHPVKVRIWERIGLVGKGYISLETPAHYISLRPLEEKEERDLNDLPHGFAPSNFEIDQNIQDQNLRAKLVKTQPCDTHPCKTYVLYLNTQPMNAMWEKIIEQADDVLYAEKPEGRILKNVKYFKGTLAQTSLTDQGTTLYFSNTTLMKGLLYQGEIYKRLYAIHNPIYFKDCLAPSSMTIMSDYEDVIKYNDRIMWGQVGVHDLDRMVFTFLRYQELVKIHKAIEDKKMTYLNIQHEEAILSLLYDGDKTINKSLEAIDKYLTEVEKRYTEQQSSWGPRLWDTVWTKEWKK